MTDVDRLVNLYDRAAARVRRALLALDPGRLNQPAAEKAVTEVRAAITGLNEGAVRWGDKAIDEAWARGSRTAQTILEILGKKPKRPAVTDPRQALKDRLAETLIKANSSVLEVAQEYLALTSLAARKVATADLQEFSFSDVEDAVDAMAAEAVKNESSRKVLASAIRGRLGSDISQDNIIRIAGKNWRADRYADMVARTTIRQAQTEATLELCRQYENDLVAWSDHGTQCMACHEYEGKVYSISGKHPNYPPLTESPPLHPNCSLPGNRLISPGGFISGIRAQYYGEAVELTMSNSGKIAVTPNHLMLTPNGFAPAHLLRKGDNIFYCPGLERIISGHPNNNGSPTLAEDIIKALSESPGMSTRSVPISPEDIHGDGRFCDSNIDIIGPDSFLRDADESLFFKHGQATRFNARDPEAPMFPGERDLASVLKALALAADSLVGGRRIPNPFFSTKAGGFDSLNLRIGAQGDARLQESITDGHPPNSMLLSQVDHKLSRFIALDKIIDIKMSSFHGFVYDLQSSTSLYLINGLISSNCEHSLLPTTDIAMDIRAAGPGKLGWLEGAQWVGKATVSAKTVAKKANKKAPALDPDKER